MLPVRRPPHASVLYRTVARSWQQHPPRSRRPLAQDPLQRTPMHAQAACGLAHVAAALLEHPHDVRSQRTRSTPSGISGTEGNVLARPSRASISSASSIGFGR